MIKENSRASLTKTPGRTGTGGFRPLDRDLAVQIRSMGVLISCVHFRSDGLGPSGVGAAALTAGDQAPRRRCAGARRTWPNVAVRGSNRPVLGSGVTYRARVVHLGSKRSSGRLGWGSPRRGADCAAAHRWRRAVRGFPALHLPKSSAKRKGGSL